MPWTFYHLNKYIDISGLYTFYYFELNKDFYFAGEKHNFWEMVYVDSGEVSIMADNQCHVLKQGEVIFHKPMEFHTLAGNKKSPPNVLVTSFEISSKAMLFFNNRSFTLDPQQRKILSLFLEESKKVFRISSSMPREKSIYPEDIGAYQLAVEYLEHLLIDLIRKNSTENPCKISGLVKASPNNAFIEAINMYLANHIYGQLRLQDVCGEFHMSRSYLCQLYKNATGKSIIDHYIDLKITCAKRLIREGDLNFTQISEKLGFTSIHHFTRIFKSRTEMSPSVYEKTIQD